MKPLLTDQTAKMTKKEQKNPKTDNLTPKQKEAIPFLIGVRSLEEGRKHARVSKFALYSWLRQEDFRKALEEAREVVIQESLDKLKSSIHQAVDRLVELLNAKSESVQLRAAEGILDFFLKSRELEQLTDRLTVIEEIIFRRKIFGGIHERFEKTN